MVRSSLFLLLAACSLAQPRSQHDSLDPAFGKIAFDQWLSQPAQSALHCTATASHAELSFYQRLQSRIEVKVDGRELQDRRKGTLEFFLQISDRDEIRYQDDGNVELTKLDENVKAANLEYSQAAFFLPGEYRLAVVILDTATGEHGSCQSQFRVSPVRNDFLVNAWRDLPAVEFIAKEEPADEAYLPSVHGRLAWTAAVHSPVGLNVFLPMAPSQETQRSGSTATADLAALIPTLKVISQTGSSFISEHVEVLDLARRRIAFNQNDGNELDWQALKTSFGEANTASIDVRSLSDRHHGAQFFVSSVDVLLESSHPPCVLVVLSRPITFESGEDLQPISQRQSSCRVVYIRYHALHWPVRAFDDQRPFGQHRSPRMGGPFPPGYAVGQIDQLEQTLKPLNPRVFDVETPVEMAKALSELENLLLNPAAHSSR